MDITELEEFFPEVNKSITYGPYTFTIILQNSTENEFVINLRIKQKDSKKHKHIKFKFGIGKDKATDSLTHESHKPHFEIDLRKRTTETFSARLYFTFEKADEEQVLQYCKGTIVVIEKIIENFIKKNNLNIDILKELMYKKEIIEELSDFEPCLIKALAQCYKKNQLILRKDKDIKVIKTIHNLKKYLEIEELKPLFLPLEKELRKKL